MLRRPGMAALALLEANAVRNFENGALGWREPPSDGDAQVDIYLKELGEQRLFGFAATDPGQNQLSQHSYLVIDNDFDPAQYGGAPALESLRSRSRTSTRTCSSTATTSLADGWHYESSAVWLEQRMYPAITGLAALHERQLARRRLAVADGAPAHLLRA